MRPLRVLLVEDDPNDADLICLALQRGGYEPRTRCVETADGLRSALAEQPWDVVLSDYSLATFSGPDAYTIVRDSGLDLPFLIVAGPTGEDVAAEAMRAGVRDFLLKGHLGRLVAAIERELREAEIRGERRNMQEQLLIAERMSWVGALAAGLVHEINNPLSVISGNLQVLERQFSVLVDALSMGGAELSAEATAAAALFGEAAGDAAEAARRVMLITRELRQFSHPDESKPDAIDVHKVLEWAIRMTQSAIRGRVELVRRFGDPPAIEGRTAALGQLFANLLINAAQAGAEPPAPPRTVTLMTSAVDGMVAVDVLDSGSRIRADTLPAVLSIVSELGGRIEVQTEGTAGTRIRILLRQAPLRKAGHTPPPARTPPLEQRVATILVVEDEPALGRVLPRLLAPHSVTVVDRARDALKRLRTGGRFDVILCDVMMPEMDGMQFHQELARERPDIARRIVFMSGGVFTPALRDFFDELPNRRLEKPLDIHTLRRLIDEMART
ncbi:MAG TPA: response regulator [Polyangia bacterium]|nr:response regulator [Polyangia bacterium]